VLGALAALFVLRGQHASGTNAVLLVCAAGVVPIILLDVLVLRVHRRPSTGLDWTRVRPADVGRILTKLLGLAATVGVLAVCYFVFPEYGDWYAIFWNSLRHFGPSLIILSILYVAFVDGMMIDPYDAYWQLGRILLFHPGDAKKADLAAHFRAWMIKGFFIPLFVVFTNNQLNGILRYDLSNLEKVNGEAFLTDLIYALDVLYAMAGYLLSLRIIDTHVRSSEPTMLGWVVALECYQPFWGRLSSALYLHYEGIGFETWLSGHPSARWVWATIIVGLEAIYLLATFSFGVRFSNLTHRGILTNGPYRFSKHPAYIAKNLSWWMITLPFIPGNNHTWVDGVRWTLALAGVSTVYFLRARTEERHLSRDPDYVAYALWMNDHGTLAWLGRAIPFFRYKAPVSTPTPPVKEAPTLDDEAPQEA
jgi:protein-S-isoprenylcysteine O-methyltransferase Ste14